MTSRPSTKTTRSRFNYWIRLMWQLIMSFIMRLKTCSRRIGRLLAGLRVWSLSSQWTRTLCSHSMRLNRRLRHTGATRTIKPGLKKSRVRLISSCKKAKTHSLTTLLWIRRCRKYRRSLIVRSSLTCQTSNALFHPYNKNSPYKNKWSKSALTTSKPNS